MVFCVVAAPLMWYTCTAWTGSLGAMLSHMDLKTAWRAWPRPTWDAAKLVVGFAALELLLLKLLPGRVRAGPITPAGTRAMYKDNGAQAWAVTHLLVVPLVWRTGAAPATATYDNFGAILTVCSLSALALCLVLYWRGPSSADGGRTGNPVFDYFWGVELHPRLFGVDLKQLVNCRLGMMSWCAIVWWFAAAQVARHGRISSAMWVVVTLQTAYVVKFFFWEAGYLSTLDMMHDRFGFYLCWGVSTWIPAIYTSQALYLVDHPRDLGPAFAAALIAIGLIAIYLNYDADAQRKRVRETAGQTLVWGRKPSLITARYTTADGREHENLLLASGWWGVARHFHYVPELAASIAWTLPCGFQNFLPWWYVIYLTILLAHRAARDDRRCEAKYGRSWDEYRSRVPFRIIPGIF